MIQRDYDCFVSYASEDAGVARELVSWLEAAGLRVWFDQARLTAGSPVIGELTRQICNSRGLLLLLTETALQKNYVKHEVEIGCEQQVTVPGFTITALRTDPKLDPTGRFPALRKLSWLDMPGGNLTLDVARRLLLSIGPGVSRSVPGSRHVFVSCGWGEQDGPVTRRVCAPLIERGVRLVGDAQDQRQFGINGARRVERIMSGCGGHLLVLPQRRSPGKSPEECYKYFLSEWEIGRRLGLPRRTLCVSRDALPASLREEAIEIGVSAPDSAWQPELVALHDEVEPGSPYVFLAADYKRTGDRNEAARSVIEHVLGMECWLGKDYPADRLHDAIIDKLQGAYAVFADLACMADQRSERLEPNVNACVEAGIALGANVPVFFTALNPESFNPAARDKTAQVPFMFRDSQINWYAGEVEYLARIHQLTRRLRRRILNDELEEVRGER